MSSYRISTPHLHHVGSHNLIIKLGKIHIKIGVSMSFLVSNYVRLFVSHMEFFLLTLLHIDNSKIMFENFNCP